MNQNEKRINHYKKKADWHKQNTPIMAKRFQNKCEECNEEANTKNGVIHHTQYTGHDYEKTIKKLLSHNAIKWLCKTCHKIEHIAIHRSEVNLRMKHSGFCAFCNRFAWDAWFKVELGYKFQYGHQNFPICDGCLKLLLKEGILAKHTLKGKDWSRTIVGLGDWNNIPAAKYPLLGRFKTVTTKNSFGDIEWLQKGDSNQKQLF